MLDVRKLQERIDAANIGFFNRDEARRAVALTVDDQPLVYAEVTYDDGEPELTAFGNDEQRWIPGLFGVDIEAEGFLWRDQPFTVRFGNVDEQPYECDVYAKDASADVITGTYISRLRSTGPMTYRKEVEA